MNERFFRFKAWVKRHRWLYAVAVPPTPAWYWDRRIRRLLRQQGPQARVLDVGAGERKRADHVWNLELSPRPPTDVAADAHALPFAENSLDLVILEALLEHVRSPEQVLAEVWRVLRPGGIVCAAVPFLQPYHPSPLDLHRWTLDGFRELFERFQIQEAGVCVGPTAALHWTLREWAGLLLSFGNLWVAKAVGWVIGWVTAPLLLLDLWLARRPDAARVASAVYVIALKPEREPPSDG